MMSRHLQRFAFALVVLGCSFLAGQPAALAQDASGPAPESAPVGVTETAMAGGGGFHQDSDDYLLGAQHRHRLCQREYGDAARMCTSREILQASSTAFGIHGWIAVSGVGAFHNGKGLRFYDTATGVMANKAGRLNCDQHLKVRGPGGIRKTGLLLDDSGEVVLAACEETHPVVCCAPVER